MGASAGVGEGASCVAPGTAGVEDGGAREEVWALREVCRVRRRERRALESLGVAEGGVPGGGRVSRSEGKESRWLMSPGGWIESSPESGKAEAVDAEVGTVVWPL